MTLSIHDHSYEDEDFWDEAMDDYYVDETIRESESLTEDDIYEEDE